MLAGFCVDLRLAWIVLTVQGNKTVRLAGALPSLLSQRWTGFFWGHFLRKCALLQTELCCGLMVFKKMQPTNQNNCLCQPHFPLCLLTREMESSVAFVSEQGHR